MNDRSGLPCMTFTGRLFYPEDPRPEDIVIEDIAHHLAIVNRYNGASSIPLSVAVHSLVGVRGCLKKWPIDYDTALRFLLHDASEAYTADLMRPLKAALPDFSDIEEGVQAAISTRFGISGGLMTDKVIGIDNDMLHTEFSLFMPKIPDNIKGTKSPDLYDEILTLCSMPHDMIERDYLRTFHKLSTLSTFNPQDGS